MQTRLKWTFDDLVTADGHRLTAAFGAALRAIPEPAERALFEETFRTPADRVAEDALIAHFASALTTAATALALGQQSEIALSGDFRNRWIETLRSAGNAIAFACGVELLPPLTIELSSPTLKRQRLEQMQRAVSQRQTADRVEDFQRTTELLKQWDALRSTSPSIKPGQLLQQLNPANRGSMLEMLLMTSAGQRSQLWSVAGPNLAQIDFKNEAGQPKLIELPTTAGPLRSVQVINDKVLVGARNGVFIVDPANSNQTELYLDPELISDYGFSDVTFCFNGIWATHRDGGIGAKFIVAGQDRLLCAVADRLVGLTPTGPATTLLKLPSPIAAILRTDDRIILAIEDGTVAVYDEQNLEKISDTRPVGRIAGATLQPWLSSARLLLTTPDGPIYSIGLDDQLVTQYTGPQLGNRAVAASAAIVAAMSPDRQRIIFWNAWDGRRPAGEIHLANIARHRIADIAFG
jgi:hypothetical protein